MPDYAALAVELAKADYTGLSDADAADKLNTDTTGTAAATMAESEMMALLQPAEFVAVFDHPRFSDMKRDIEAQNHAGVAVWVLAFHARGSIGDATRDALLTYVARTIPASTVAVAVFGVAVSAADVAHARSL